MNHYCYEDIQIGQSEQFCVTITPEKMTIHFTRAMNMQWHMVTAERCAMDY